MKKTYAIQGYQGSFHQVAVQRFFGKTANILPCATFRELIDKAQQHKVTHGAVMAIENSLAGAILPNYRLLQKSSLQIVGEVYLKISQHLLVNPGVELRDIKEVMSHPMAILQCVDFLSAQPWKIIETEDTALSAQHIHSHKNKHTAAIASGLAAEMYQLEIIAPAIQTEKNNITRFLVLERKSKNLELQGDKASIYFQTNHTQGVLAKVLEIIAKQGVNLSKLQSLPIPGSNFKYGFYVDLEFDDLKQFQIVMKDLPSHTNSLQVLGVYNKGKIQKG
ncbi:MAG: prephenate dehydratase [Hydrotalea sp.]|nr:prephenate dehydratase [Hydrotalea sp.]